VFLFKKNYLSKKTTLEPFLLGFVSNAVENIAGATVNLVESAENVAESVTPYLTNINDFAETGNEIIANVSAITSSTHASELVTNIANMSGTIYQGVSPYNDQIINMLLPSWEGEESSSVCENAGNDIYNKLKVVLTDTNYIKLRDKIDTHTTTPQLNPSDLSNCEKLKELFCDKNYQKIKHFINIGLHVGNNIWNIEDNAQSNADNCDSNTLNKGIICGNMSNLLDNFHIIKQGIIDCDPPDPSTRSYRSFDLNCSPMLSCSAGQKLNSNVVDVTTRFKIGDTENACVPCSPGQITDTPYSCSNCVNTKPNTNKEQCVGCVDGDYTIGSCSWTCTHTRPDANFISSTTGDTKFCGSRRKLCPAYSCTPLDINGLGVRIHVKNDNNTESIKCLQKQDATTGNNENDIGFAPCYSSYEKWVLEKQSGYPDPSTYRLIWKNDVDCAHCDQHNQYLDVHGDTDHGEADENGVIPNFIGLAGNQEVTDDPDHNRRNFRIRNAKIGHTTGSETTFIKNYDGEYLYWNNDRVGSTTTGRSDNIYFTINNNTEIDCSSCPS
jgi:hypothetical protein